MSTINVGNVNTNSVNGGQLAGFRNKIINGNFALNQRGYSSASTLSSGTYAHDRWKAGASGGDYSFTQSANGCTITIAAGKTLIQVIEDANIEGGTYVLSWSGTAQARYGVDSATPSGSYADSPITITGQSASTTMSVEFDDGTLSNVQLELGSTATTFEQRGIGTELALCQRYYQKLNSLSGGNVGFGYGICYSTTSCFAYVKYAGPMRAAPTISQSNTGLNDGTVKATTALSSASYGDNSLAVIISVASGLTVGRGAVFCGNSTSAYIDLAAEL